ncbi:type II CRISPR-associated endonuclease Cas1 [Roseobacter sp. HKCCA0434]|uniref:type II CRISPR-associated endonuclease Cas1 n=1 Tax=Roseobacter sp. HKCCA0434 TaxID=3079297 RepID=UPI002905A5C9|nr:type II CRISPR-associated endonuclease Cas1 [Roseobacter sp. HKCCA0434]
MEQIVDISSDGRHLSRDRGFLKVEADGAEVGRVPLDRIAAVILHGHGTTWTASLMVELARRGALTVLCGRNHAPVALLWPIEGHHAQGGRMQAQWAASRPAMKQAWKMIVQSKIMMQAAALRSVGEPDAPVSILARSVRSGDPANIEAQAARRYWPLMMGKDFRRDVGGGGANGLLNYGYTVLRAATARAVIGAGLHPTIGLHHRAQGNSFALADDLMEPFRPLVDLAARRIAREAGPDVTSEAKQALARIIAFDMEVDGVTTPVSGMLSRLALSLARSFESGRMELGLPKPPAPLRLMELGR